jgi:hypothetical protein
MNQSVVEAGIDNSDIHILKENPYSLSIEYEGRLLLKEIKALTVITK